MSETRLVMASEWMTNGNVNEFVKAHVDADRLELVSPPAKVRHRHYLATTQC